MNHTGTQKLETARLILRRFVPEDAAAMYANWASDSEVTRYMTWPPHASAEVTGQLLALWISAYEKPDSYNWVLELKATGEIIGNLSVVRINESIREAELGWCMSRRFWGQGYMPEAARAVVDYLFDVAGFDRVCARHDAENAKSGRVMQKIGMTREGLLRKAGRNNRGVVDEVIYAILKTDPRG